jgi:hypothetical protein
MRHTYEEFDRGGSFHLVISGSRHPLAAIEP